MTDKILYCVLNWGLGHASRSIPIIETLLRDGDQVSLASDGASLSLLRNAFPKLPFYVLPAYDIEYKHESIAANILSQCFKILRAIRNEKDFISNLIVANSFTKIISDNRFGCYNKSCHSVFISHQLRLLHPSRFIQAASTRMNLGMIAKFDECWIPDYEGSLLSGKMSSDLSLDMPLKFIGAQSRFKKIDPPINPVYQSLSILSGPEPQRSYLQEILAEKLSSIKGNHVIITGLEQESYRQGNVEYLGLKNKAEITELVQQSKYLISRAGYSSIMDYEAMSRKAILIPTPGQTEQEYLGKLQGEKGRHIVFSQDRIDLNKICI